ncbi:nuclear pore complex protein Nup50 [Nasonia vitripennis]|uniref:RanBD1 domain-containing protein n=1 Tax=Nasonia vitripennis TaxID=7425 RepID=A0A7M7G6J7_NASVI|nr:nuclear pore complex protein Nup50 [Nasonia vitripennis]XP_008203868.1 nuclear pore complex protein Nup50 [Nasonia vitripennis]
MAGKRTATSDLNADNWNQEDEPEEAGTFKKASEDVLSKRVVKAARRRLPQSGDESTKSAFGGFTGFKSIPAGGTSTASPFSFLAKAKSESSASTTSSSSFIPNKTPATNGSTKISENGIGIYPASSNPLGSKDTKMTKPTSTEKESPSPKKPSEYYAKLKGLNQSVAQWIKSHVDANPVCILTPIFRDYEKYLKEIEAKHGKELDSSKTETKSNTQSELKPTEKVQPAAQAEKKQENFIFGSSSSKLSTEGSSEGWKPEKSIFGSSSSSSKSIFSSGDKSDAKSPFSATSTMTADKNPFLSKSPSLAKSPSVTETKKDEESNKSEEKTSTGLTFPQSSLGSANFSFGQSSSTSTAAAGFSFGSGKPFTFGSAVSKPAESEEKSGNNEEKEDEDDEPPKPDFKPVTEEGSIYEQKCKVFVKKDGNYSDRGVGTLFLKPAPNDKMQLIVRAVNSLGNLLLNTLLNESIPIKRLNKTNIMLVCLPLPTAEPPPVATLLRVKTPEEADALFEALEKHKK